MGKIKVSAGSGRSVPIPSSIASGPGGTQMVLRADQLIEVEESHSFVQRGLRNGDLVRQPDASTQKGA